MNPKKPSTYINRRNEQECRARMLLRKVDSILKSNGIEAALAALTKARVSAPLIKSTLVWFNRYRDMLLAWHADIMPEVVDEFQEYGFRRAKDVAYRATSALTDRRLNSFYWNCQEALTDMAERSRLVISDMERELDYVNESKQVSIDDVSEDELENGEKL